LQALPFAVREGLTLAFIGLAVIRYKTKITHCAGFWLQPQGTLMLNPAAGADVKKPLVSGFL